MTRSKHIQSFIVATAIAFCAFTSSGNSVAAEELKPDADAKIKKLEEHVKLLEKRITDLEADAARPPRAMQTPGNRLGFRADDFNSMFEQLRKQMMENNDGQFEFSFPAVPHVGPNVGPNGNALQRGGKPTLGVGVDEVSDDLKKRFKNDIKEGAFVMNVYPNSPAEKAGIAVGDAITAFDDKPVTSPKVLIDAVKSTAKGSHDILLSRHGELLKFKVELPAPQTAQNDSIADPNEDNVSPQPRRQHFDNSKAQKPKDDASDLYTF